MDTKVLIPTEENIAYAARLIEQGEVVGMPKRRLKRFFLQRAVRRTIR